MRRIVLSSLLLLPLALSGCSTDGGSSQQDPPAASSSEAAPSALEATEPSADDVDVEIGTVLISVPQGWEVQEQPEDNGLLATQAFGEEPSRMALSVVSVPTSETDLATALEEVRTQGEVSAEDPVSLEPLSSGDSAVLLSSEASDGSESIPTVSLIFEQSDRVYVASIVGDEPELARQILGTTRDA
ncbi:hypothetical protein [Serinicoccus kebangsaanensis]|uniref:hypothetical protein n=1 Tax=Serinicoccus kebangsaanensis TaxID=2602069 RepID=UPI00124D224B|nr:hypothetical protein [Serinicoccus kebangsaanensis]